MFPLFELTASLAENLSLGAIFTAVSLVRSGGIAMDFGSLFDAYERNARARALRRRRRPRQ